MKIVLLFAGREPFESIRSQIEIAAGLLKSHNQLEVESFMPTSGIIFSDGIESDFLRFNRGAIARIEIAEERASLVQK